MTTSRPICICRLGTWSLRASLEVQVDDLRFERGQGLCRGFYVLPIVIEVLNLNEFQN